MRQFMQGVLLREKTNHNIFELSMPPESLGLHPNGYGGCASKICVRPPCSVFSRLSCIYNFFPKLHVWGRRRYNFMRFYYQKHKKLIFLSNVFFLEFSGPGRRIEQVAGVTHPAGGRGQGARGGGSPLS